MKWMGPSMNLSDKPLVELAQTIIVVEFFNLRQSVFSANKEEVLSATCDFQRKKKKNHERERSQNQDFRIQEGKKTNRCKSY